MLSPIDYRPLLALIEHGLHDVAERSQEVSPEFQEAMRSGGHFNFWWWASYLAAPLILLTALVIRPKLSKKLIGVLLVASMLSHCALTGAAVRTKYATWHAAAQTEAEHERATMYSETEQFFGPVVWCGESVFYPLIVLWVALLIVGKKRKAKDMDDMLD